mmetsp:Transcript_97426/g.178593  ORF Transcript_97426/g.178593 Transcript_97426/m.178593 type:complete len:297 (+) Transcript_97426:473-1363(+)
MAILISICIQEARLPASESGLDIWVVIDMHHELFQANLAILVDIEPVHDGFSHRYLTLLDHCVSILLADMVQQGCKLFEIKMTIFIDICFQEARLPSSERFRQIGMMSHTMQQLFGTDFVIFVSVKSIHDRFSNRHLTLLSKFLLIRSADMIEKRCKFFNSETSVFISICFHEAILPSFKCSIHQSITCMVQKLLQTDRPILVAVKSIHDGRCESQLVFLNKLLLIMSTDLSQERLKFAFVKMTVVVRVRIQETSLPTFESCLYLIISRMHILQELLQANLAVFVKVKAIHDGLSY